MKLTAVTSITLALLAACGGAKPLPPPDLSPEPIQLRLEGVVTERTEDTGVLQLTLWVDTDKFDAGTLMIPLDPGYAQGTTIVLEPWDATSGEPPRPPPAGEELIYFVGGWWGGAGEYLAITEAGSLLRAHRFVEDEAMEEPSTWTVAFEVAFPEGAEIKRAGDGTAP